MIRRRFVVFRRSQQSCWSSDRCHAATTTQLPFVRERRASSSSSAWGRSLRHRPFPSASFATAAAEAATARLSPLLVQLPNAPQHPPIFRIPKKGTGFDNFLRPRGGDGGGSNSSGGGAGRGENNNNNNSNTGLWWAAVVALGLALYVDSKKQQGSEQSTADQDPLRPGGGASSSGAHLQHPREISWHDFLRLLEQDDVVKVLVDPNVSDAERPVAKVYLKPNAIGFVGGGVAGSAGPHFGDEEEEERKTSTSRPDTSAGGRIQRRRTYAATSKQRGEEFLAHPPQDDVQGIRHHQTPTTITTTHPSSPSMSSTASLHHLQYYRLPIGNVESFERKLEEAQRALGRDMVHEIPVQYAADKTVGREMLAIVPGLLLAGLLYAMIRFASMGGRMGGGAGGGGSGGGGGGMGGIFQIGKSTHKKINKQDVQVTFADVAGCDEAKKEIMEFVDFLKDSDRFTKLGAKIPKGALLCGPPGTGYVHLTPCSRFNSDIYSPHLHCVSLIC